MTTEEALKVIRSHKQESGPPDVSPWITREGIKGYSVKYPDQHWGQFIPESHIVSVALAVHKVLAGSP